MASDLDRPIDAALRALPPETLEALLLCAIPRRSTPELQDALSGEPVGESSDRLWTAHAALPGVLEEQEDPPGYRIAPDARPALLAALAALLPERLVALHERAAACCAARAAEPGEDATGWETEELYHRWSAGAPDREAQADALFRGRLRARDAAGCGALIQAVADAGGGDDPLPAIWRGLQASELTRDWGEAETHFQRVLARRDLPVALRARALMESGLLDFHQGRFADALRQYDRSVRLAEDAGESTLLARALSNRGIACTAGWMQRQLPRAVLDEALSSLLRARDLFAELRVQQSVLNAWNNLGIVYKELARHDEALAAYREALALVSPSQPFWRAGLINNIAEVDEVLGHLEAAQAAYGEVLAIWRETGGDFEIAEALVNLGGVQERRGLIEEAIASYRAAIAAVESLRSRLKAEEARTGFLATRLAPYERLIALCLRAPGREALAFETVERAKARAFIELLADKPLRPPRDVPSQLLDRERQVREALDHLYQMGVHAGAPGGAGLRAARLEADLEEVYRQLRRLDAQYAGIRTVDTLSLEAVRERLPVGALLLEYFGVGDAIGCFAIARDRVRAALLPGLAELVDRALQKSEGPLPAGVVAIADPSLNDALHAAAFEPFADLLADHEMLYLVPHGSLHYLPLHALGAGAPLLERHRIAHAPSASILLRDRGTVPDPQRAPLPCLAYGYGGSDLRYAELEARHVAALTGGIVRAGAEATAAALLAEGGEYRCLHLVCHGTFNPQAPLASGLLLADGKLDAMTVMQRLRLRADLVTLSACDTGQAKVVRGDELMGLARAFLYAGAAAVLVSLWPVDDLATALLMDAFYRARAALPADREGLAEALRRAQLAVRRITAAEVRAAGAQLRAAGDTGGSGASPVGTATAAPAGVGPLVPPARGAVGGSVGEADPYVALGMGEGPERPYAHPFYWAAFTLICG